MPYGYSVGRSGSCKFWGSISRGDPRPTCFKQTGKERSEASRLSRFGEVGASDENTRCPKERRCSFHEQD